MKKKYENEIKELKERVTELEQQYKYLENKDMKSFIEERDTFDGFYIGREFILHYIDKQSKKYKTYICDITHITYRSEIPYMEIVKEDEKKVYIIVRFRHSGVSVRENNMYIIFDKSNDSYFRFNHSQIKEINEFKKEIKNGRKKNV